MLVSIFKNKSPFVIGLILIITLSFWVKGFFEIPQLNIYQSEMPLYQLFLTLIHTPTLLYFSAFFLFLLQMVYLLILSNNFKYYEYNFFFHLLLFSIIANFYQGLHHFLPIYWANLFFMMGMYRIFRSTVSDYPLHDFFEASFFISIASLFYFNMIFYLVLVWIGLLIIRPLVWREWLISIIGALLPYLFVSTYYFVFVDYKYRWFFEVFKKFDFGFKTFPLDGLFIASMALISFMVLSENLKKKNLTISNDKIRTLLVWIVFTSLFIFTFIDSNSVQLLLVIAFAAGFILPNYLLELRKKWLADIILLSLLAISIYRQFFY